MPRARRGCSWKASELCVLLGRKRGVALFIREGLMYRERLDLGTFTEGMFESVFI